ncbi:MAG: hypothetical protein ABSC94_25800 [Polyangiaceae bacterium]|jgi:hypothetical protein
MPETVRYIVPIVDFASVAANAPNPLVNPADIVIVACPGGNCPATGGAIAFVPPSPALAAYQIDLPYNFFGSVLIMSAPDASAGAPDYIPTDYFFGGPLVGTRLPDGGPLLAPDGTPVVEGIPITPITYSTLDSFYQGVGGMFDMTKGLLVARLLDCNGNRAAGVTLNVQNPGMATGYTLYSDYLPVQAVPGQPFPISDSHGVSGYANLDPRNYIVSATTPDGKATYAQMTVATILANVLTEVELRTDVPHNVGR